MLTVVGGVCGRYIRVTQGKVTREVNDLDTLRFMMVLLKEIRIKVMNDETKRLRDHHPVRRVLGSPSWCWSDGLCVCQESGIDMEIDPIMHMYHMLENFLPPGFMEKEEIDKKTVRSGRGGFGWDSAGEG